MRVALCFYGTIGKTLVNGKRERISLERFRSLNERTLFNAEVDVFAHCWGDKVDREEIRQHLSPKQMLVEKQENLVFPTYRLRRIFYMGLVQGIKDLLRSVFIARFRGNFKAYDYRLHSRWLSIYKSVSLLSSYEQMTSRNYDVVLCLRYDIMFSVPFPYDCIFPGSLYVGHWNNLPRPENNFALDFSNQYVGEGFIDLWFAGDTRVLKEFSKVFLSLNDLPVSQHFSGAQYWKNYMRDKVGLQFILYRWVDFELIRTKEDGILPPLNK